MWRIPTIWSMESRYTGNRACFESTKTRLISSGVASTEMLAISTRGVITLRTAYRPGFRLTVPGSPAKVTLPLEFAVRDNGPGVAEDLVPHLFDPFVTTKAGGTGLGLALVAKIVGDHGGVIECNAAPGNTEFRILMPAHSSPESESA